MPSPCLSPFLRTVGAIFVLCVGIVSSGLFDIDVKNNIASALLRHPISVKMASSSPSLPLSETLPLPLSMQTTPSVLPSRFFPSFLSASELPATPSPSTLTSADSVAPSDALPSAPALSLSRGVVFIAMTAEAVAAAAATLESARSIASASLQAHLFTGVDVADSSPWSAVTVVRHVFTSSSPISLLGNSTFQLSLLLTSGDTVCIDVHIVLDALGGAGEGWDLLLNAGSASYGGVDSLGMLGYRMSAAFCTLLAGWLLSGSGTLRSLIDFVAQRPPGLTARIGVLQRQVEVRFFSPQLPRYIGYSALISTGGSVFSYPLLTTSTNRVHVCS